MSKQPPTQLSQFLTQAAQKIAKANFRAIALKKGAKVPELWVEEVATEEIEKYPLLGDRYLLGRSSRSCDIVISNPIVSHVHCSLHRNRHRPHTFLLKDEQSTNGTYLGKRRLQALPLRHGDTLTLGPPDLKNAVTISYHDPPPTWVRSLRYALYGCGGLGALLAVGIGWQWSQVPVVPLPASISGPVVVYARDGQTPLSPLEKDPHRELPRLADFSPYLPKAVIASEDSRYYWHLGVDPLGVARALAVNVQESGIRQGASTLTQQLARSLFPQVGRQDTAGRKWREMAVALKLEAFYSKEELLRLYLNRVYLGAGNYGFEDAAQFYFDKSARDLTLSEAATLVAMLPAPNRFNPVQDYETALKLRNRVLSRLLEQGWVSAAEAARARRTRLEVSPQARKTFSSTLAPYFYSYVFEELQALLGAELAKEGNFIVETGLDLTAQGKAEQALREAASQEGPRYGFSQGALVTLDTRSGEIIALTGGVDYRQSQFNRATQAQRQPGSTFKVFAYAAALERGLSPSKTYSCAALRWRGQAFKPCERSSGAADMYRGLAQSENAIALRVGQEVGLNRVAGMAQRLGIRSPLNPVPGLVLGQSEVNLLEMTGAYAAFANRGVWNRPHAIRRILDGSDCQDEGNPQTCRQIYAFQQDETGRQPVLSPGVAETMTALLRGAIQGGTGKAAALGLGEAGKTGTTDRNVDLWFIGYLPERHLAAGIWLGNDDNSPTKGSSAQAAALWGKYVQGLKF